MSDHGKPHPSNVPGDFYVVDQCCTACGVPTAHAPEMFEFVADKHGDHCYVKHQPSTPEEVQRALNVMRWQELGCIRYGGSDEVIRRRLGEAGEGSQCDVPPPSIVQPVLRNHASVDAAGPASRLWAPSDCLERFRSWLASRSPTFRITSIRKTGSSASLSFAWYEDSFHEVVVEKRGEMGRWLIHHSGNLTVSEILGEWLMSTQELGPARWYSPEEWRRGGPGQDRPW
jgi:hypothetical protein